MKTKRWTLLAATGVTVLASSMAFAAGSDTGSTVGAGSLGAKSTTSATVGTDTSGTGGTTTGTNAGAGAGVNAGSNLGATTPSTPGTTGAGTSAGGMSSSHMSTEGAANTNGLNATDPDKGTARAEDRSNTDVTGKAKTHTRTSMKHHKVAKPSTTDSSGS